MIAACSYMSKAVKRVSARRAIYRSWNVHDDVHTRQHCKPTAAGFGGCQRYIKVRPRHNCRVTSCGRRGKLSPSYFWPTLMPLSLYGDLVGSLLILLDLCSYASTQSTRCVQAKNSVASMKLFIQTRGKLVLRYKIKSIFSLYTYSMRTVGQWRRHPIFSTVGRAPQGEVRWAQHGFSGFGGPTP